MRINVFLAAFPREDWLYLGIKEHVLMSREVFGGSQCVSPVVAHRGCVCQV